MKKIVRELAIIFMAFAVTFTSLPMMTGDFSAHAASAKKPAKVTGVKKKAAGTNYITVKWNRIKKNKNTKGYTIYMNGSPVKSVGKNTLYYRVDGLSQNTNYTFQVKAYNAYKQKQYYNSKTMKWQAKKPKKKTWKGKKTRKVTKYKYGASSAKVTIKTARAAAPANLSSASATSGGSASAGETRTVTDFKGVTRTITRKTDSSGNVYWTYRNENGSLLSFPDSQLWCYDKTMDGQNATYKQQSGATFRMTGGGTGYIEGSIGSPKQANDGAMCFSAYNINTSKLDVKLQDASLENVNTYFWNQDNEKSISSTVIYVKKNGKRLAIASKVNDKLFKYENNMVTCFFYGESGAGIGTGIGIFNGEYNIQIVYDGITIGTIKAKSCSESLASNGMSPTRRKYYAVAEKAINGNSSGTIWGDYRKIADWIEANITNAQAYDTGYGTINRFDCIIAAGVLETWLIYNYGESAYGFTRGTQGQPSTHRDFCLNSDATSPLYVYFKN